MSTSHIELLQDQVSRRLGLLTFEEKDFIRLNGMQFSGAWELAQEISERRAGQGNSTTNH